MPKLIYFAIARDFEGDRHLSLWPAHVPPSRASLRDVAEI